MFTGLRGEEKAGDVEKAGPPRASFLRSGGGRGDGGERWAEGAEGAAKEAKKSVASGTGPGK